MGTGNSYKSSINEHRTITFKTTQPLGPNQGITIAVAWPKGIVAQPTVLQKLNRFFYDNILTIILFLILLIFFLSCSFIYYKKFITVDPITISTTI